MFNLKQVLYALAITSIFLVLILFTILSYNGDEESNKSYQLAINQKVFIFLNSSFSLLNNIALPAYVQSEEGVSTRSNLIMRTKDMITISRKNEGLSIVIRNSKGGFAESILPIFKKRSN